MRINRALNLVIPVETDSGQIYVHSTPISRDIFEQYFMAISKTFAAIFSQGLGVVSGPRIAYLVLKQKAMEAGNWAGADGVEMGLVNEIIRLTNVIVPGDKGGWTTMPLASAISRNLIDADILAELEGELIFFTVVSLTAKRTQVASMMDTVNGLWGSESTAFSCTEYLNSLQTSTATAPAITPVSTEIPS